MSLIAALPSHDDDRSAAAGAAAGVVISSAMNIGSELKGPMKARVNDLAEVFADRAVEFYEQQGWR